MIEWRIVIVIVCLKEVINNEMIMLERYILEFR
jgi:hypothetical protein